jgi:hypothetical protein
MLWLMGGSIYLAFEQYSELDRIPIFPEKSEF